jgi:hypothetical protein
MRQLLRALLVVVVTAWPAQAQLAGGQDGTSRPFAPVVGMDGRQIVSLRELAKRARDFPERSRLVRHYQFMELATRVYGETDSIGSFVFGADAQRAYFDGDTRSRSRLLEDTKRLIREQVDNQPVYHWKLLHKSEQVFGDGERSYDVAAAKAAGFLAATYVNHGLKQVVVAIAGTDPLSLADIKNDLAALVRMKPSQFDHALSYFRDALERYRRKLPGYAFACTGHSLGGGACAYAAAMLGEPAVVLNPIGAKWIAGLPDPRGTRIENYIDPDDFAFAVYSRAQLPPVGELYWIKQHRPENGAWERLKKAYRLLRPENSVSRVAKSIAAHSADTSLTRLARFKNLPRLQ